MLMRLAIAQLRAHKTATAWNASLMTVLVALLTAIVIFGATQATITAEASRVNGYQMDHYGTLNVYADGVTPAAGSIDVASSAELETLLAGARDNHVMARATVYLSAEDPGIVRSDSAGLELAHPADPFNIDAFSTPPDASLLASGAWPAQRGEVALSPKMARQLDASIGDSVTLYTFDWGNDGIGRSVPHPLTLVGITTAPTLTGYDLWMPSAYVSWDEVTQPGGALSTSVIVDEDGTQQRASFIDVHWDGFNAGLEPYSRPWEPFGESSFNLPMATVAWFGAAGALFVAMIVMAFAVGRNQAASRTQWVATARVMGARRSAVAAAALVESLILAAVALVAGTALGVGIAQAQLALARAQAIEPFGPSAVTLHWAIAPVVVSVTLVMAVVIAAVPAFWAARVSPTAALKPVSDVTEAEVSRRIHPLWLVAPMILGVAMVALGSPVTSSPGSLLRTVGWITVTVIGFVLVVEWLRALIPSAGRALGHTRRAPLMAAGDALVTRPRQGVAPALLMTVGTALTTLFGSSMAVREFENWGRVTDGTFAALTGQQYAYVRGVLLNGTVIATLVVAAIALQLVVAAIAVSTRTATAGDTKALRALGMSGRVEAIAAWWQLWMPQAIGAGVGLLVGAVAAAASASSTASYHAGSHWPFVAASTGIGTAYGFVVTLGVLALAGIVAAAVSVLRHGLTRAS